MNKGRRGLYLLAAAGLLSLGVGGGTFATFNATTVNPGNTFTTGDLFLSNQVNDATVCLSEGSGSSGNSNNCSAVITANQPSSTIVAGDVSLKNTGSISASSLQLTPSTCSASKVKNDTFNSGDLCAGLDVYVEEVDQGSASSYSNCWVGACPKVSGGLATAIGTTSPTTSIVLTGAPLNTVANGDQIQVTNSTGQSYVFTASGGATGATIPVNSATSPDAFGTNSAVVDLTQGTTGTAASLASLTTTQTFAPLSNNNTVNNAAGAVALGSGATRTFQIGLDLPTTDNTYQDLKASFDLTWTATQ